MKWMTVLVGAWLSSAASVSAQPYLGASVGSVKSSERCEVPSYCDLSDSGYKLFAGYQFMRYVGIEAAYVDLGNTRRSFVYPAGFNVREQLSTSGFELVGVLTWPITERLSVFAKIGGAYLTVTKSDSVNGATFGQPGDSTRNGYVVGIGAAIQVAANVRARVGYERIELTNRGSDGPIAFTGVGLSYHF